MKARFQKPFHYLGWKRATTWGLFGFRLLTTCLTCFPIYFYLTSTELQIDALISKSPNGRTLHVPWLVGSAMVHELTSNVRIVSKENIPQYLYVKNVPCVIPIVYFWMERCYHQLQLLVRTYWLVLLPSTKAAEMDEESKAKIRSLSQSDIPIEKRRALYNQLARKMKHGNNLKAGLVEKYQAAISSRRDRWNLLKEFMIDENMPSSQYPYYALSRSLRLDIFYNIWTRIFKATCGGWSILRAVGVSIWLTWHSWKSLP